jgi:mannosyltransferase OCH1-like enzyme
MSKLDKECMKSWRKFCPGYAIVKWDENNFDVNCNKWVREAYGAKKYAFVSDYVRFFALYNHGGVYMDTDEELLKPIDSFLASDAVVCFKDPPDLVTSVFMCFVKGHPLLKEILNYYDKQSFSLALTSPRILTNILQAGRQAGRQDIVLDNKFQEVSGVKIYPSEFFVAKNVQTLKLNITGNTYGVHHATATWRKHYKVKRLIKKILGHKIIEMLFKIRDKQL